jgi:hypothetical protein
VFHLLFWLMCVVFTTMELHRYVNKKGWGFAALPMFLHLALIAMLVYVNTLILIPYLLQKKKLWLYILGITVLIVVNMLLTSMLSRHFDSIVWPNEPMTLDTYFHWNFFFGLWFILISTMLYYTQKWTEHRQQLKNIEITQLQTELKYLRAQVNPHFLFNGLNTIYGNIDIANQAARDILVQFSDLLRYNLYEADTDWVELEKETIYLQNYVALQRARSDQNLQIELDINVENSSVKIAPLIFIAFVENAFKYSGRDESMINRIQIRLHQSGKRIVFECSNSYEEGVPVTGGIGLNNVARRLELLYKDQYELEVKKGPPVYYVRLTLMVS